MAFLYEIGQRRLVEVGWTKIARPTDCGEAIHQGQRNHHVPKAKRRKERLAEGPGVNHSAAPVQALQGCDRHALIAVLAVVIVLHDPGILAMRPIQQLKAARNAHRSSQWILVRWSNKRGARVPAALHADSDIQ